MKNLKLVKVASVRKHMDAHFKGEISYTEAVNRINEDANKALNMLDVVVPSEQLPCDVCGSNDVSEAPHMGRNCNRCNPL